MTDFSRFRGRPTPQPKVMTRNDWFERQSYRRLDGSGCTRHPECLRNKDHEGHCKLFVDFDEYPDYFDEDRDPYGNGEWPGWSAFGNRS